MTRPPASIGRYSIARLIAHGGMGTVYLARDPAIDRLLAIKLLKEGFDDAAARERFAREARAAGRLHHPNIVTVFDVGEHDNRPFIAMEYVPGETLAALIEQRAVGDLADKLATLEHLCAGLHYAHRAGIVHRDIKPANVMRDGSGTLKILDFGIARGGGTTMTRTGDIVGTLNYMSPEQLVGGPVDRRTDVYSVGTLAYELITDQMAFPGSIQSGVLFAILNSGPVSMASLVPGIDPDISATIERAMARDPDARYQDLEALRRNLAVMRARLLEAVPTTKGPAGSDATTRSHSVVVASDISYRPPLPTGPALPESAKVITAKPSSPVIASLSGGPRPLFLGLGGGALIIAAGAALLLNRPTISSPPQQSASTAQQAAPAEAISRAAPGGAASQPALDNRTSREEELQSARVTARAQIVDGQRQSALGTLIRGLAIDPTDRELNSLADELYQAARQASIEARAAAALRGASARSSTEFRQAQVRAREADHLLAAGDRAAAVRSLWAAALQYAKAPVVDRIASAVLPPSPPPPPPDETTEVPPAPSTSPPPAMPASSQSIEPTTTPVEETAPASSPAPATPEPSRRPAPDPETEDPSTIRDTLDRYAQAYRSLDTANVARVMPYLSAEQLRSLGRDLSNYRRYTVEITDERLAVNGATATVTCQVVRSFETKSGVNGRNTVPTVFHLRRSASGWTIERLESR